MKIYKFILVVISLLLLIPIISKDFYISHDGFAHVARFAAYFKAFQDGQIIPRWAGNLNAGYGSPLFIFFYPLPGYLASFIHLLGINFENIFKVLIFLGFSLSGISFFFWLKRLTKDNYISLVSSIIYIVLPYRILDTFVRGDVAELTSFIFVPLVFLFINKVQENKRVKDIILGGFWYALLILSHNAIAFIFSPVFFFYSLFFAKKTRDIFSSLLMLIFGLSVSAFFWIPSVLEGKYVYAKLFVENIYRYNFVSISNLIYSPWGFGSDINQKGGLSAQVGIWYATVPILLLVLLFFRKIKNKKEHLFWFPVFILSIFMTTPYAKILWDVIPVIKLMGYPWRFTSLSGFAACMLVFYLLSTLNRRLVLIIAAIFVLSSLPFIKVKGYVRGRGDNFYYSYLGTTDYHRRTSTIWTEGDFASKAKNQIEIIGGIAKVSDLVKKETIHSFKVSAKTNTQILDNTVYYPGWKVKVDEKEVPIEFQDMNHRGLITFRIPSGEHRVIISFNETRDRLFSDLISALAILLGVGLLSLGSKKTIK